MKSTRTGRSRTALTLIASALIVLSALCLLGGCVALTPAPSATDTDEATEMSSEDAAVEETEASGSDVNVDLLPAEEPPRMVRGSEPWTTDFSKRIVEWDEILSGGPPRDGIPAVDEPTFESVESAGEWLKEQEPVIFFQHEGDVRAYPLAILMWHEIVNDIVGEKPVVVTFCPLCNASIVFDAELDGLVMDFGTTGRLRNSDLVMYDRQTETWWQQFTGQGLIGEQVGKQLIFLPSQVISFGDFSAEFPDGQVLERPPANRRYGVNPYTGYDSTTRPFLFRGEIDDRLPATERVVGLELGDMVMAYSFSDASEAGTINDDVADTPIVVFHKDGTTSALDGAIISESRDIGSVGVFDRRVGEQTLTFEPNEDGTFTDAETGSTWNILGQAVDGELAGEQLAEVLFFDHFWFAWAAFFPDTGLYEDG